MGKAHSNAWVQAPHFFELPFEIERKVICARDRVRLDAMAATWGWSEAALDWRAVVERSDVDVVDVCVPNALHAPIAVAAAQAGKMVLCEKPLATSAAEASRMVEAARRVRTGVWFNYRRCPAIALARDWVEQGRMGRIFHYRAKYLQQSWADPTRAAGWRTDKAQAGSGAMGDLLSHLIDTALHLNGPIAELTALAQTFDPAREVDDAALVLARFANGSVGTFEATKLAVGEVNRNALEMNGAGGMLRFDLEDMNRLELLDASDPAAVRGVRRLLVTGPDHPYWNAFWKPGHTIGYEHTFIATLGDFLAAVGRDEPFHPDFEDGLRVQEVLEAVSRSAASRQWTCVT